MRKVLFGAAVAMVLCGTARADIIISRSGAPVATGDGLFAYTYSAQLTAGQLDPVNNGTPVQFGTIYDFGPLATTAGVVNNPTSPSSVFIAKTGYLSDNYGYFTFSFDPTNTPAGTSSSRSTVVDNPLLTNIRFTYVGSTGFKVIGEQSTLGSSAISLAESSANLGTFTVYSPFGTTNPLLTYDGQTYKGSNNTAQANQGSLSGPLVVPTAAVPEPATWAMMILGMGAVGFAMRSAKRRSDEKFDAKIKRITEGAMA